MISRILRYQDRKSTVILTHCQKATSYLPRSSVDFSTTNNSFRINWSMCREKGNIGNGDRERRRNSLADYPIIRFSGTFAIYVSEFYPSLGGGRPFRLRFRPPHRRAVGIFVSISQKSFSHTFLSQRIPWSRVLVAAIVDLCDREINSRVKSSRL